MDKKKQREESTGLALAPGAYAEHSAKTTSERQEQVQELKAKPSTGAAEAEKERIDEKNEQAEANEERKDKAKAMVDTETSSPGAYVENPPTTTSETQEQAEESNAIPAVAQKRLDRKIAKNEQFKAKDEKKDQQKDDREDNAMPVTEAPSQPRPTVGTRMNSLLRHKRGYNKPRSNVEDIINDDQQEVSSGGKERDQIIEEDSHESENSEKIVVIEAYRVYDDGDDEEEGRGQNNRKGISSHDDGPQTTEPQLPTFVATVVEEDDRLGQAGNRWKLTNIFVVFISIVVMVVTILMTRENQKVVTDSSTSSVFPTPAPSTPAPSTPARSTPAPSTPARSTPAPSTPAPSTLSTDSYDLLESIIRTFYGNQKCFFEFHRADICH